MGDTGPWRAYHARTYLGELILSVILFRMLHEHIYELENDEYQVPRGPVTNLPELQPDCDVYVGPADMVRL